MSLGSSLVPEAQDPMANNTSPSSTGIIDLTTPLPGQVPGTLASRLPKTLTGAMRRLPTSVRGPPTLTIAQLGDAPRVTPIRNRAGQRLSRFVFTLNNYTEDEEEHVKAFPCKYLAFGHEVGDEGTRHLQGFCIIGKQVSFSTIKADPGLRRAHIEPMKGNFEQNFVYVTKQDVNNFFEKGERPTPGKRNDLTAAVALLKSGKTLRDIVVEEDNALAATLVRYPRGFQMIADMLTPPRTEPPLVCWISGPTGVGKTRAAVELADSLGVEYWISHGNLQWFNGFRGQPVAILDDYRTKHAPFEFILRLLDRYRLDVPFKGGYVSWTPYIIIVTAPKSPTDMWSLRTIEDLAQLSRRCHLVSGFTQEDTHATIFSELSGSVVDRWSDGIYPWELKSGVDAQCTPASASLHGSDISGEGGSILDLTASNRVLDLTSDKSCTTTEELDPPPLERSWKFREELTSQEAERSTASTMSF